MHLDNFISEDTDTYLAGPPGKRQATLEDARRPPVEAGRQEGGEHFSPTASIKDWPRQGAQRFPSVRKAVCGRLFCNDSVSDNDTPVLPKGGRLREILAGVRVPWSGEASRRLCLRPDIWGSSVECRCEPRFTASLNVRSNRDCRHSWGGTNVTPLRLTSQAQPLRQGVTQQFQPYMGRSLFL